MRKLLALSLLIIVVLSTIPMSAFAQTSVGEDFVPAECQAAADILAAFGSGVGTDWCSGEQMCAPTYQKRLFPHLLVGTEINEEGQLMCLYGYVDRKSGEMYYFATFARLDVAYERQFGECGDVVGLRYIGEIEFVIVEGCPE